MSRETLQDLSRHEPVLALCGPSGSGKTTAIEQVIPVLCQRGLSVAVVKHSAKEPSLDPPGKDSARLFAAGADVVLQGPGESVLRRHTPAGHDLSATLYALLAGHDLVLVEGHKGTPLPKLWLATPAEPAPPPEVGAVVDVLPADGSRSERLLAFLDRWLAERLQQRRILGGILIGGNARRMGRPKQLLSHAGTALAEVVAGALQPHVEQVVLIGSGESPPALAGMQRLPDVTDARGPLAGMLAAMRWAPRAAWVITACDLPLACPDAVAWLVAQRRPGRWAILPRVSERGIEPLLALYEPQARRLLEEVAASGRAELRLIGRAPAVVSPEPPAELSRAWFNVNTPEDLAALDEENEGVERER